MSKFICENCARRLTPWEIFKLNFGADTIKKFRCKCGNEIGFKENVFLKYTIILFAGTIVFLNGNLVSFLFYISIILILFILYFKSFNRISQ